MNRAASLIAPLILLYVGMALGPALAQADEPHFLGRTRHEWVIALDTGGRRERTYAAWAISQFAVEQVGPTNTMLWLNELCLLAESDSPSVRYWGFLGISRFLRKIDAKHPARATALAALTAGLKDLAIGPRLAAAEALADAGETDKALPVLVGAMTSPQESVRIQAVAALEGLGPAARPALGTLQSATSDSSEYVKRIASRALSRLDTP